MLSRRLVHFTSRHLNKPLQVRSALQQAALSTSIRTMAQEYRLKGITSLDLKNGEKQEAEIEGIENGKVLLVKVKDQVHATSANCTHYGAPLKLGVVTGEGRLTCPWHGGNVVRENDSSLNINSTTSLLQYRNRRRRGCTCARPSIEIRNSAEGWCSIY